MNVGFATFIEGPFVPWAQPLAARPDVIRAVFRELLSGYMLATFDTSELRFIGDDDALTQHDPLFARDCVEVFQVGETVAELRYPCVLKCGYSVSPVVMILKLLRNEKKCVAYHSCTLWEGARQQVVNLSQRDQDAIVRHISAAI